MIARLAFYCFLAAATFSLHADDSTGAGQALAEQMRSAQPMRDSEIHGVLQIRGKEHKDIPVACKIVVHESNWETIYETTSTNQSPAERLVIIHHTNEPNEYLYAQALTPGDPVPEPKSIPAMEAARPLAGSDFWLTDLGLDFLHWPLQRKLPGEMRLGQPCYVLESRDTNAAFLVRIKSFIDKETVDNGSGGGILRAEGYDKDANLVKEFSLHGSSFKKVNGQYQVEKMEIRSPAKKSQTTLKFNLPKE